jgi:hypothetical protein
LKCSLLSSRTYRPSLTTASRCTTATQLSMYVLGWLLLRLLTADTRAVDRACDRHRYAGTRCFECVALA